MSVQLSDTAMTSEITRHRAEPAETGLWRVSWLPRPVDRNRAITALLVAEHVEVGADNPDHPDWHLVQAFAEELGLDPAEAVRMIQAAPDDEVVTEIRQAYVRWRFTRAAHDRIMPLAAVLADEKIQALGMTRAQWSRVIDRLALTEGVHVDGEADQKRLTAEDHAAAVTLGGTARHTIRYTADYVLTSEGPHILDDARAANEQARPDILPGHEDQAAEAMRSHLAELDQQRQRVAAAVAHVREHGTIRLPDLSPDVANHVLAVLWTAHDDQATTPERRDALYPLVDLLQQAMTVSYEQTTS